MGKFRLLVAWLPLLAMPIVADPFLSGPIDYDAGLRAVIYDDLYKLGLGAEVGAVSGLNPNWDVGLHLNYTHFRPKTESWPAISEYGGYVTAYYLPTLDQDFSLRLGPHIGYAHVYDSYLDIGGDLMAVFKLNPTTSLYANFVPSYFLGSNSQALVRVGLGVHYRTGG